MMASMGESRHGKYSALAKALPKAKFIDRGDSSWPLYIGPEILHIIVLAVNKESGV
jgi:hypothetical protein